MKFFKRLKQEVWKVVRGFLFLGIIASIVITIVTYGKRATRPDHLALIVDANAGYGVDDLFAISRLLIDPDLNPEALLASQNNYLSGSNDSTMLVNDSLNSQILALHNLPEIPHLQGAMHHSGYLGNPEPQPSPASEYIIERIKTVPYGQKIDIVTLGSVTNLATAILTDSSIADKIRWYCLGMQFDHIDRIWNKNEFNTRNDLDAMDFLLNSNLETHIMPANVAEDIKIHIQDARDLLEGRGLKWDLLLDQWKLTCPNRIEVELSSLMLIEAIMNPDLVTEKKLKTPPENSYRDVYVYTWIDKKKVMREFTNTVRRSMGDGF